MIKSNIKKQFSCDKNRMDAKQLINKNLKNLSKISF